MISTWTLAALALLLVAPAPAVNGQVSGHPRPLSLEHRSPDAMSATDRAALDSRQREVVSTARIYGYNLEAGNWSYEQTLCAPMPGTIMLHYFQDLPGGAESLFTALVPRAKGRVRVVPVLYRNATPFLPAPKNPHNYALFNELVPLNIARREAGGRGNWLALSACYAELTGPPTNLPSGPDADIGIAGAPSATVYVDVQHQSMRVTLANREGQRIYKIWTIAFNQDGRVTDVATEDRSVVADNQPAATAESPETNQTTVQSQESALPHAAAEVTIHPAEKSAEPTPQPPAGIASSQAQPAAPASSSPQPAAAAPTSSTQSATSAPSAPAPPASASTEPRSEPGWKYVLHPAEPPSKIVRPTPSPSEKDKSQPPDSASQDQPPQ